MSRSLENLPLQHTLETNLHVYNGLYSIDSLRVPLMQTFYGRELASLQPRYSSYYWEDLEKFQEMFGPDVDPVQHGPYQARSVAIPLLDEQRRAQDLPQIDELVEQHFVAHHVQHDDHEGEFALLKKMKSDIPHRQKTAEIAAEELSLWFDIHTELFGEAPSKSHFGYVREFESSDTWLSKLWEISERMGYMETGVRAVELAFETEGLTAAERSACREMGKKVVGRHFPIIEEVRDSIAYASISISAANHAVNLLCDYSSISREELFQNEAV